MGRRAKGDLGGFIGARPEDMKHWWDELDYREQAKYEKLYELANQLDNEFFSIEESYGDSCRRINAIIGKIRDVHTGDSTDDGTQPTQT